MLLWLLYVVLYASVFFLGPKISWQFHRNEFFAVINLTVKMIHKKRQRSWVKEIFPHFRACAEFLAIVECFWMFSECFVRLWEFSRAFSHKTVRFFFCWYILIEHKFCEHRAFEMLLNPVRVRNKIDFVQGHHKSMKMLSGIFILWRLARKGCDELIEVERLESYKDMNIFWDSW